MEGLDDDGGGLSSTSGFWLGQVGGRVLVRGRSEAGGAASWRSGAQGHVFQVRL